MRRALVVAAAALLLLTAGAASAENPVLDPEGDADLAASLAEATEVQQVCYGYELAVMDFETGQWNGTYLTSNAGPGTSASSAECTDGVELRAQITYTSSFSEAEDSATWTLASTLPELTIEDVERLGLSADDLLDDARSETVLLNAVQALPRLAAEQAGRPPVVLQPATAPAPPDARATNSPGSDWLRENGPLLGFCVLLVLAGLTLLALSRRRPAYRPG